MAHDPDPDRLSTAPQDPPRTLMGTLRRLGPGMIIAGSIVGSGELIATTKVGAEAGFWLLWLVLVGCVIKSLVQVEMGRHTVAWGRTPLAALDQVPGPRLGLGWVVWCWCLMTALVLVQQGGIVGGVGQALTIGLPLTQEGKQTNQLQDELVRLRVQLALARRASPSESAQPIQEKPIQEKPIQEKIDQLQTSLAELPKPPDPHLWASILAVATAVMLGLGRYKFIEWMSMFLVAAFTGVTILTLFALQSRPEWAISGSEIGQGLSFGLPPAGIVTALAAFGIIGVGAAELVMYPYWCLEKGYARFTGPRDGSPEWIGRARGWMRVMYLDAGACMVLYTFATVAFYLLGAAVLHRTGLIPENDQLVRTLCQMYEPVFGTWAKGVFIFGAFAVLYSTFFVAAAGHSRMIADLLALAGAVENSPQSLDRWTRGLAVAWCLLAGGLYLGVQAPVAMVLASGVAQTLMLPVLGAAALWFRHKRCEPNLAPNKVWDVFLWISVAGFFLIAGWYLWEKLIRPWTV